MRDANGEAVIKMINIALSLLDGMEFSAWSATAYVVKTKTKWMIIAAIRLNK